MIAHAATLDVSPRLLRMVTTVINRARRGPGRLPSTRAVSARTQAVLVIRYLRDALPIWRLARDAGVSMATGYRYLHEGLTALAEQAPTLTEAITQAMDEDGVSVLCLDGTLVPTHRVDVRKPDGRHLFYSGKHKAFGVNVQVIATTNGDPLWTSDGSPGSVHDTRAAREHVMDELAPFVSRHTRTDGSSRLTVLGDKGYTGLDVGILTPTKRRRGVHPHVDEQTRNALLVGTRAVAERANAALVMRWHALRRVTLDPAVVGVIAAAALVLTRFEKAHGQG